MKSTTVLLLLLLLVYEHNSLVLNIIEMMGTINLLQYLILCTFVLFRFKVTSNTSKAVNYHKVDILMRVTNLCEFVKPAS